MKSKLVFVQLLKKQRIIKFEDLETFENKIIQYYESNYLTITLFGPFIFILKSIQYIKIS